MLNAVPFNTNARLTCALQVLAGRISRLPDVLERKYVLAGVPELIVGSVIDRSRNCSVNCVVDGGGDQQRIGSTVGRMSGVSPTWYWRKAHLSRIATCVLKLREESPIVTSPTAKPHHPATSPPVKSNHCKSPVYCEELVAPIVRLTIED